MHSPAMHMPHMIKKSDSSTTGKICEEKSPRGHLLLLCGEAKDDKR
jgi:hypothetical protein